VVVELNDETVRELIVKTYRLIYEIEPNRTVILAFLHGARRFPSQL
jgi:plasmid stabilization system protein ParE